LSWWCGLSLLVLVGCQTPQPGLELIRRSQPLLGTFVTVSVYAGDRDSANQAIDAAFDEFRRVDALMSIHRADSEVSRLNARAAQERVAVSSDLFRVIAKAQEIAEQTEGSFDITIRPLTDLWGFIWKEYRLPSETELQTVLPRVNYRFIELNLQDRTVRFLNPGVTLDLGGIAKGYAVDCAIGKLLLLGVTNAMVKAGGDLRVIGTPPGKSHWIVQLEDPRKEGARIQVPLGNAALSTSGNYENFFEINGQRYSHILNPRTGLPVQSMAACTVIAPTCIESDALATACFVYGAERSIEKFGSRYALRFVLQQHRLDLEDWTVLKTWSFPNSNRP
jgi:thiamine biosynthesis lipoprotein ApbE